MATKQIVAVIGAGPSGICALRWLTDDLDHFIPVAFEKNREVGGLWNYSDFTETDEYGLPCSASIYKQLRYVLTPLSQKIHLLFTYSITPSVI